MDRPDLLGTQRASDVILHECAIAPMAYAAFGADPDIAGAVFQQRADAEIGEPIGFAKIGDRAVMPPRNAFVGADPDATIARLKQRADEVVYQSGALFILHSLPVLDTERSFAFGADPQRARQLAHHVAHAHAGERRRH